VLSPSNRENVFPKFAKAFAGFVKSITVIMIEKICRVLPDMYIIIALIGSCFAGARAISQAFLIFKSSVSAAVGGLIGFRAFYTQNDDEHIIEECTRAKERKD